MCHVLAARAPCRVRGNTKKAQLANPLSGIGPSLRLALASVDYGPGWYRAATLECPCWV
jgi:hypothetical protein